MFKGLKKTKNVQLFNMVDPTPEAANQLINSFIIGMINLFGTMLGVAAATLMQKPIEIIISALLAFGFSFFATWAAQRGLKAPVVAPKEEEKETGTQNPT